MTKKLVVQELRDIDGDEITQQDRVRVGQAISLYHLDYDFKAGSEEEFNEILNRTNAVEDALLAAQKDGAEVSLEECIHVITGHKSVDSADLPSPSDNALQDERSDIPDEVKEVFRRTVIEREIIPEFQEQISDDTIYCHKCDKAVDAVLVTLSTHNAQYHEWHPEVFNYNERCCRHCGEDARFKPVETEKDDVRLVKCVVCNRTQ